MSSEVVNDEEICMRDIKPDGLESNRRFCFWVSDDFRLFSVVLLNAHVDMQHCFGIWKFHAWFPSIFRLLLSTRHSQGPQLGMYAHQIGERKDIIGNENAKLKMMEFEGPSGHRNTRGAQFYNG
ncbi:hypothetical protein TREMEDRAFT_65042 [Tremella mesenterica DSM 1558]|uniref:uncharacterized protein n=1 Tax=Tremella mesenterica (strain ATCC 24925 / CBS 8224 / DSM 1558 / NBRC 9311 / NRRL Y-6157 / RJB 2259-6 / UBC 559-6) TaxID=578456 RepID=UPI00032C72E4|nr:uncharacterized protein TREMEDRAFT_65042 [Tremella mesenterica DSM 1558]EIW66659.1 hypothetical protein TREMEDRAFT_65042 [Tremella mesenterica DSM 1558]